MISTLEEIYEKVLKDKRIFAPKLLIKKIPDEFKFISSENWFILKNYSTEGKIQESIELIDKYSKELKTYKKNLNIKKVNENKYINQLLLKYNSLKQSISKKHYILNRLFVLIDWFGIPVCYLPNMDIFGRVIERYNESIIEEFFTQKLKKLGNTNKKALKAVFEYYREMKDKNISSEQISFFIRKINSLDQIWRLLDENKL